MDRGNFVIGIFMLALGALGIVYYVLAVATTPQPHVPSEEEPNPYPRVDRFLVPLILPISVALCVAAIIFLLAQILLVVPESAAPPIALVIALLVLLGGATLANADRIPRGAAYAAIGIPAIALIAGGTFSYFHMHPVGGKATPAVAATSAAPQLSTTLSEITTDNHFSQTSLTVPAGKPITLTQTNKGQAIHDWHVLDATSSDGKPIATALTSPGQTSSVTFTITKPGVYHFHCDVHPTEMTGTITVVAAGAQASTSGSAAAAPSGASGGLQEVTTDNKFSQTSFTIKAGQQVTLTQTNKGQAIHDWHVLGVTDSAGKPVATALTQPGQSSKVTFTITKPGTYKFQCDVHPTQMVGTLTVQ